MKHPLKLVLAASVFLSACSPSINEQDDLIAQVEKETCYQADQTPKFSEGFEALQEKKWDINQLGCGAVYAYEQASDSLLDIELKLMAVGAQITYLDALEKQFPRLYQAGEKTKLLALRWDASKARAESLLDSVSFLDGVIPEVNALKGIFLLVSTAQNTSTKDQLAALPVAKKLLDKAYASDNDILEGLGRSVLGQLYVQLPSFAGGNQIKGIEHLEEAHNLDPNNMELFIHLASAYQAIGDTDKFKSLLTAATKVPTDNINPQDLVDWAYKLGGMTSLMNMDAELAYFSELRHTNLKDKPYLMARKTTAELGHGGADPITGKDLNEI